MELAERSATVNRREDAIGGSDDDGGGGSSDDGGSGDGGGGGFQVVLQVGLVCVCACVRCPDDNSDLKALTVLSHSAATVYFFRK